MTQATTWGHPLAAGGAISPEDVAAQVDESLDSVLSSHSGATRPTYAVQGTIWHDTDLAATTPLFFFDGTADRAILTEDADGNVAVSGHLVTTATTVASLAASPAAGARSFVTDANATTFASVVAAGGANGVPVYFDGTDWRIG